MAKPISIGQGVSLSQTTFSPPAASGCGSTAFWCIIWLMVLTAGVGLIATFGPQVFKAYEALSWDKTECKIVTMKLIKADDGHKGHKLLLLFSYVANNRKWQSTKYHWLGEPQEYKDKKRIVADYPPGSRAVCYVNPKDVGEAVLQNGWYWDVKFILKVAGPPFLVLIGLLGFLSVLGSRSLHRQSQQLAAGNEVVESIEIYSTTNPFKECLVLLLVCAFWNGVLSIFVQENIADWMKDGFGVGHLLFSLFLLPFVLIGLAIVIGVVMSFLQIFNPKPRLFLKSGRLMLGERVVLSWKISRLAYRVRELTITLEGKEEATYVRGTSTSTDTSELAKIEIFQSSEYDAIVRGDVELKIPLDMMHSFAAKNNKITWKFKVNGRITFWPSMVGEFPIVILPQRKEA